jgi:hypothetical protein
MRAATKRGGAERRGGNAGQRSMHGAHRLLRAGARQERRRAARRSSERITCTSTDRCSPPPGMRIVVSSAETAPRRGSRTQSRRFAADCMLERDG